MTSTNITDRARLAENDYFRRRDAELIEQARLKNQSQQPATGDSLEAIETRALADALGVHDDRLIGALHADGFRAGNSALLDWLPAIDVAWVGNVDVRELHELRTHIAADPRADAASVAVMTEFLFIQPSPALMDAAREVLRRQLAAMEPAARQERLDTILERCESVAEASGGVWIVGAVSAAEHRRIAALRAGLADRDGVPEPAPAEIPH